MRPVLVVVGIALVVIGVILAFVPLAPQGNETIGSRSLPPYDVAQASGYSLTGTITVLIQWTASAPATVGAVACAGTCHLNWTTVNNVTTESGTSGSFTLHQPDGGEIAFGVSSLSNTNVTFSVTTALTTVGAILVVAGVLLAVVGLVLSTDRPGSGQTRPPSAPSS
jgi:uncharacterized membrane protein